MNTFPSIAPGVIQPTAPTDKLPTDKLTSAEALIEAYASLCGVQEIMRDECDSISQRDPLERLVFDQDAALMFAAELDNARRFMEIAFEIAKQEKARRDQHDRIAASGLILPISRLGH